MRTSISRKTGANAQAVDKPIDGLLTDLKSRGLLDSTLVVWGLPNSEGHLTGNVVTDAIIIPGLYPVAGRGGGSNAGHTYGGIKLG